jgi:hypothetical protein
MPPANTIRTLELTPEQEKRRRISVKEAAWLKGVSEDTFCRHFAHLIEKITPRRDVVRLGWATECFQLALAVRRRDVRRGR